MKESKTKAQDSTCAKTNGQDSTCAKKFLTTKEAAAYLGISMGSIYKLMCSRLIAFYKPNGKNCYFKLEDIESWVSQHRVSTDEELQMKAESYCRKG